MRRTVLAILALVVSVAGPVRPAAAEMLLPSAPPPADSIGIRLLEAPADAADDPRAQVHIVDHLPPGTVITRRIEISSTTGSTLHAALYPAAAHITGGSFSGADGRTENDLSSWTSVEPPEIEVPAGGRAVATVTIAVPSDAAPGEQYAVVWAEARSASVDGGIAQVSRVGLRVYLSVGPGGAPAPDFTIESLTAERRSDGAPRILATVHNTGGRALDLAGALELSDGPGGVRAGPFRATLGTTLAVGATEPVTIALDGELPAGPWLATITLHSGRVERTAEATVTFPVSGSSRAVDATSPHRDPLSAAAVVALLAATALLAALVALRRRNARALVLLHG
jgi:hypothetical protein